MCKLQYDNKDIPVIPTCDTKRLHPTMGCTCPDALELIRMHTFTTFILWWSSKIRLPGKQNSDYEADSGQD